MEKADNTQRAHGDRPRYVDSVKAAAAVLGYPEPAIQYLKDSGNEAWQGSRCYIDRLEDWIDENGLPDVPESELDRWNLEVVKERHRKLRIANDMEEGKLISRDEMTAFLTQVALLTKQQLQRAMEDELPQLVAGKSADEIRQIMKREHGRICDRMQEEIAQWTT